jgi:hypothetical protein
VNLWTPDDDARSCAQERAISRYAACSRQVGQAAEPSAALEEPEEADEAAAPDEAGEPAEPDELEDPDPPDELDESPEPLAAGTDEEEPLRESVR